jgi:nucleotide-binding universal stress UspA family protein
MTATPGVVPELAQGRAARGTLVVGFDRHPASLGALGSAADLGQRMGAALLVVHVVDLSDYPVDPDRPDWEDKAEQALAEEEAAVAATLASYPFNWTYEAVGGDPVNALIAAGVRVDALMVVVGSRGERLHRVMHRLASPSVAHRLIERCGRPVLVVHPTGG